MGATVTVNSPNTLVHAGSTGQSPVFPDVCKTPSPGGPIPIPYVNIAMDSQLAEGSTKTKIEGNPIALESSNISTSSGDEPGTAGGIMSSKFKGKFFLHYKSFFPGHWFQIEMIVKAGTQISAIFLHDIR